jgi:hypothetical protein
MTCHMERTDKAQLRGILRVSCATLSENDATTERAALSQGVLSKLYMKGRKESKAIGR